MSDETDFEPRVGKIGNRRARRARGYLSQVIAAANLVRGDRALASTKRSSGGHLGRGAGVGRLLGRRAADGAFRRRRVAIKARIVKLAGKGAAAAAAHLRYVQRDGTTREGSPSRLYGSERDNLDAREFLSRGAGDRHQFRFIVSAEDGAQYEDLRPLVRRLMARMEDDLGTRLDWVAVDHFDTGHPHTHIVVRGKDERGGDLLIARDYLSAGMRERAAELVDLDLGPRTDQEIAAARRGEIVLERLTSIDRALLREATDGVVSTRASSGAAQSFRLGRLRRLAVMGLASPLGGGRWRLDPDCATTLKAMGERGDIVRTMQRALAAVGGQRAAADWVIDRRLPAAGQPLVGRVVACGLADEHGDRRFLILDATDGRTHYLDTGRAGAPPLANGSIVRIERRSAEARQVDRTTAEIAAANGGRYTIDAHLRRDATATQDYAQAHVRRLEAIRRATGQVTRELDGTWVIAPDHVNRAAEYERSQWADRPVSVEILSHLPLEELVEVEAATWLDRDAVTHRPITPSERGFGAEIEAAKARRRAWLAREGLLDRAADQGYPPGLLDTLRRRDVLRCASAIATESGRPFSEAPTDGRIEGIYRRHVDLASGRFAVVERARDFTLVPWREALESRLGKEVAGLVRGGSIDWHFSRGRQSPSIA